jgi:Zn-dependent M16 (insulinase) family peptidase
MMDLVYSGRGYAYTEDDLRRAKTAILTARQMRLQAPERVALLMTLNELYGLGYDFEDKYAALLKAVTADDLKRVVAAYINQPVVCITTPQPELVSAEELSKPFDAARLKEMRSRPPQRGAPQIYRSPE